jgi:hypothetical protein
MGSTTCARRREAKYEKGIHRHVSQFTRERVQVSKMFNLVRREVEAKKMTDKTCARHKLASH